MTAKWGRAEMEDEGANVTDAQQQNTQQISASAEVTNQPKSSSSLILQI